MKLDSCDIASLEASGQVDHDVIIVYHEPERRRVCSFTIVVQWKLQVLLFFLLTGITYHEQSMGYEVNDIH